MFDVMYKIEYQDTIFNAIDRYYIYLNGEIECYNYKGSNYHPVVLLIDRDKKTIRIEHEIYVKEGTALVNTIMSLREELNIAKEYSINEDYYVSKLLAKKWAEENI
jgi:hypothetical protein